MFKKLLLIPLVFLTVGCSNNSSEYLIYDLQSTIDEMEERITFLESENDSLRQEVEDMADDLSNSNVESELEDLDSRLFDVELMLDIQ